MNLLENVVLRGKKWIIMKNKKIIMHITKDE